MDPENPDVQPAALPRPTGMAFPLFPASMNVPLLYADVLLDVQFGAFTTKMLLAVEHGPINQPALQVVMPTAALLQAAHRIIEELSSKELIDAVNDRQKGLLEIMAHPGGMTGGSVEK